MKALLFGIQGSGKSTIGKYIASKYNIPFIAMGDLLRELREEDSERGRLVKSIIEQGHFVPDEMAMEILDKRLDSPDTKSGFVLDGAPRNLGQEKLFKHDLDLVILVNLGEEEAIKRLMARGRHDDEEETIRKRMDWHKKNTTPLIDFFKNKGVRVLEIDNSPSEQEVKKKIDELLEN